MAGVGIRLAGRGVGKEGRGQIGVGRGRRLLRGREGSLAHRQYRSSFKQYLKPARKMG